MTSSPSYNTLNNRSICTDDDDDDNDNDNDTNCLVLMECVVSNVYHHYHIYVTFSMKISCQTFRCRTKK